MDNQVHNQIVSFIWGIADDCLRDVYVRGKYRDVILPMTVIRRLDAMLEETKPAVLAMKKQLDAAKIDNQWPALCNAAGQAFCNASPFLLKDLTSRSKAQTLKADFIAYLDGFSPNVQVILDKFKFRNQIDTMVDADILGAVIEKFTSSDINLSPNPIYKDSAQTILKHPGLDNHGMGTIFEELIRKFNEENNEEAGEHWTPRDVVELMADLVFMPIADKIKDASYSCYDGACGTGGMLTVAQDRLLTLAKRRGKEVAIHLFGQEINPETYAICTADMLLKGDGEEAEHIMYGSTLSDDQHASRQFDFMLSNPPYGKSWKTDAEKMGGKKDGTITALFMEVCANTGPYGNHCLTVPMNSCSKTMPLFKVDNMAYDLKVYYTNTPPAGAYQGYGTPKGTYGIMMAMAELADKLGIDYRTMVEKNHVEEGYMLEILKGLGEGREGAVVPVGSCGLDEAIQQGCDMIDWGKKEVSDDPDWKIGKGFAMIMQGSGLPGLDHAEAIAKLETDGTVILNSGGADLGTGLDTISAKIVAEVLKLPMDRITVVSGDTDSCAFDTGAYASSGTFFSGNASLVATTKLKELILKEAALQLEEKVEDLDVRAPGEVYSKTTGATLSYYELVHTATSGGGRGQPIAHGSFVTTASSVPYGAHFAQVAVNIKTGEIKVQKFYALQDAGTPINPEIALCQMYGAVMKSIGHSLYEDMKLDKNGKCINANLTDYGAPMIDEAPEDFKSVLIDVDDKFGPYGAKSISEIACNGAAPAIGIAIHDACGVWLRSWPMTPEKVLKALGKI